MATVEATDPMENTKPKARIPLSGKFSMPRTAQKAGSPMLPVRADSRETPRSLVTTRESGDVYRVSDESVEKERPQCVVTAAWRWERREAVKCIILLDDDNMLA